MSRSYNFMESEPEVHDLLLRFLAQWRAKVGPAELNRRALLVCEALDKIGVDLDLVVPAPTDEHYSASLSRLNSVLMELPSTDVWDAHASDDRWEGSQTYCRLHGSVHGANAVDYRGCDRLAWIGDKLLKAKYGLKDVWPEPGVWSSWFESSRSSH